MEREEAVEYRGALMLLSPAAAGPGRALEAPQLAAQFVPLLLAEALHVRLVVGGERDARAGGESLARDAVARRAQDLIERGERRRVLGDVLERDPARAFGGDPARDRARGFAR